MDSIMAQISERGGGDIYITGTAVARWLSYCATNRKVAGSILANVIQNFH